MVVHEAAEAGRWSLLIALAALAFGLPLLIIVVGGLFTRFRDVQSLLPWVIVGRVIIGTDRRVSTSKTVAVIWTYSVASALLSLIVARWMGHPDALARQLENGLQANYGLLVGGPLGAAILAKAIVVGQIENATANKDTGQPAASQIVSDDAGSTDLGDLQYVLFNAVALVFFFGELLAVPQNGLPDLPDLLVGLTSVAAVGYLGKKVLPQTPAIAKVEPDPAVAGKELTIAGVGLVRQGRPPSEVLLDNAPLMPIVVDNTTAGTVVKVTIPAAKPAGSYPLAVRNADGLLIPRADPLVVKAP
jgi:hypothetical protein